VEKIKAATEKPSPEIIEWARQEINEEEIEEQIREMRSGGGLQFKDFIDELKQIAAGHE
jgi:primosomal protein N''